MMRTAGLPESQGCQKGGKPGQRREVLLISSREVAPKSSTRRRSGLPLSWPARLSAVALCFLTGCVSPRMTVKQGYDFSKIRRVSVAPFNGPGGDAVSDEFVRILVGSGLEITDGKHPGDVTLNGSVTEYKPSDKLMVFLGDTTLLAANGQNVVMNNPIVSLSGSQVSPQGPAMGVPNAQVVSVSATVGVIARLVDTPSGNVVWADSMNYEGLDIQSALQGTVGSLVRSLSRAMPQLKK